MEVDHRNGVIQWGGTWTLVGARRFRKNRKINLSQKITTHTRKSPPISHLLPYPSRTNIL